MSGIAAGERALLDLSFVRRGGRTVIDRRLFAWPFVVTRSFYVDPARTDRLTVIVQTGSGAIHGEDSLAQRLLLGPGTAVCLTSQGATPVHRATPSTRARELVNLHVGTGASLEYLPEPCILFPDAALSKTVELDCADDAYALIFDAFTMHDPIGTGRRFRNLESTFCLKRSGSEPLLIERTRLDHPNHGIFRGYRAFGSAFIAMPPGDGLADVQGRVTDALKRIDGLYGAASVAPAQAGLGIRLAARELRGIRQAFDCIKVIYRQLLPNSGSWSALRPSNLRVQ